MIEIEFEPPSVSTCACCGKDTVHLTRFVKNDGDAYAVYHLMYTPGHELGYMSGLMSLGEWGESATPADRLAFAFRLWETKDSYGVGLMDADAARPLWGDTTFLGRLLNREEALAHPWREEVFHLTDHIVLEDTEAIAFLAKVSQNDA
jgi:hypothetical protein